MDTFLKIVGAIVVGAAMIAGLAIVMAYPTKWIVNYLVSPSALMMVFGAPVLTIWKAIALNFICGSLFKSSSTCNCKK